MNSVSETYGTMLKDPKYANIFYNINEMDKFLEEKTYRN